MLSKLYILIEGIKEVMIHQVLSSSELHLQQRTTP
jgi:hypothetical protein